jgi:hypothetical protein
VDGALTNGVQIYSLVITGSADVAAPVPLISAVSPTSANRDRGSQRYRHEHSPRRDREAYESGQADIVATAIESLGDMAKCRVDITGHASGLWNVVVVNPDGQSATLPAAFSIIGPLWQDDQESGAPGWTHGNSQGSVDNWALVTTQSHSPTHSWFAAGPRQHERSTTSLRPPSPFRAPRRISTSASGTPTTSRAGATVACSSFPWMAARGSM